jgi:hypothetical protein
MDLSKVTLSDHLCDDVVLFEVDEDDRVLDHFDPLLHMLLVVVVELHLTTAGHQEEPVYVTTKRESIRNLLSVRTRILESA